VDIDQRHRFMSTRPSHFSATNDYRNTAKIKKTIVIPDAGFSAWSGARDATIQPLFQLS
jgi:hypothetical protein